MPENRHDINSLRKNMSTNDDSSSNPGQIVRKMTHQTTWWQAVLAVGIGVGIGLILSKNIAHKPIVASLKHRTATMISQKLSPHQEFLKSMGLDFVPEISQRTNILLMGVDSNGKGNDRWVNTRSDTMVLASLNPEDHSVGLISIPRDSRVTIPGRERRGPEKINSAHAMGGPELAVETVREDFGIPVDHYVVVDTDGLKDIFEAIGPVKVNVEKKMKYRDKSQKLNIDLAEGEQVLDPKQVEGYVRFRHDQKGDIGRIERQQWFLRQASAKFKDPSIVLKLPELMRFAKDYIVTDMSVKEMAAVALFAKDLESKNIETAMIPGEPRMINGGSYWIPDPQLASLVVQRLAGAPACGETIARAVYPQKYHVREDWSQDAVEPSADFSNDVLQNQLAASYSEERPFSLVLKYPQGSEEAARNYEKAFEVAGYNVRSKVRCKSSECHHEQIFLNSYRADKQYVDGFKKKFPLLDTFAVVLNPTPGTRHDITVQITADTVYPVIPETAKTKFQSDEVEVGDTTASKRTGNRG